MELPAVGLAPTEDEIPHDKRRRRTAARVQYELRVIVHGGIRANSTLILENYVTSLMRTSGEGSPHRGRI